MRNLKEVDNLSARSRASKASERHPGDGETLPAFAHFGQHQQDQPDSPFPFLEELLRRAKDSPFVVIGVMISIAAIIVGAVMSLTVGFGIFLFTMNGTMHEVKQQQTTSIEQLSEIKKQQTEDGNAMRAYEAANGKRIEFIVALLSKDQQQVINDYDRAHPTPLATRQPGPRKE